MSLVSLIVAVSYHTLSNYCIKYHSGYEELCRSRIGVIFFFGEFFCWPLFGVKGLMIGP